MNAWTETQDTYAAADGDAAEELFRSVYPTLAGWVRRLVDDDGTAHEIASEAFARLLSRWTRVTSRQQYLYVIAANLVRDHWRTIERERRAIHRVTLSAVADLVTCPAQGVEIRDLIASLPPRLRDPFLLRYYGDFGIREVAALLRKPEGTIKADLLAARARLRTALGNALADRRYDPACRAVPGRRHQPGGPGGPGSALPRRTRKRAQN